MISYVRLVVLDDGVTLYSYSSHHISCIICLDWCIIFDRRRQQRRYNDTGEDGRNDKHL